MDLYLQIKDKLEELGIEFEIVEHEAALTTEQADSFIEGMEGVRTKNMFLTNKKKTAYYLLIMDDKKRLDMKKFAEIVQEKRITMVSPDILYKKMLLEPGIVSPFGLLNNVEKDIEVYFDKEIISEKKMTFHPNTNEKTIFLDTTDLLKFIEEIGYTVNIIDL